METKETMGLATDEISIKTETERGLEEGGEARDRSVLLFVPYNEGDEEEYEKTAAG